MIRLLLVIGMALVGLFYALRHPFYALLFYVWNAYFRPESWVWDEELVRSLRISYASAILVLLTTVLRGEALRASKRVNLHVLLVVLFTLHGCASALLSPYQAYAFPIWVEFLKSSVITCLIATLTDSIGKLRLLLITMAFSLGFEGTKQAWLQLILNPGGINENMIPFLGDNNCVAVGMLALVPLFGALARTSGGWMRRLCLFFAMGVLIRAITTYSRGAFLSAIVLAVLYVWRSPRRLPVMFGVVLAAALILPVMPTAFWERMGTIVDYSGEKSAEGRLYFWKLGVRMAGSRPLLGVGFSAFNAAYDAYDISEGAFGKGRSVHSSWFGVLSELGFVGALLFLTILVLALYNCQTALSAARRHRELGELGAYAAALQTSLIVFMVGATFLPFQYNEMLWHMVGVSIVLRRLAGEMEGEARGSARALAATPRPLHLDSPGAPIPILSRRARR